MFLGEIGHAEGLKALGKHPVKIGIVGRGLIGLLFVRGSLFGAAHGTLGTGELVSHQSEVGVAAHGVRPGRERFRFPSELPEGFTLLLAGEDQIVARGQRLIERDAGLLELA